VKWALDSVGRYGHDAIRDCMVETWRPREECWMSGGEQDKAGATAGSPMGLRGKRAFDVVFTLLAAPLWLPLLLLGMLAIRIGAGLPVLYVSTRRVHGRHSARIAKLRTMVPNAAQIANRATVPITSQRFLNIPLDSPLYTRVGRTIERFNLTELPQFVHVLAGRLSVIGNRPLPEDVVHALVAAFPDAEARFLTPAGLTGPTQLVGRQVLSDAERLTLEIAYCRHCIAGYSWRLDCMLAAYTALILARLRRPLSAAEVLERMQRWSQPPFARAGATVPVGPLPAATERIERTAAGG
jgi:lipopolysaccharide/colanic/teichoic acid biosynthesis glycosyltransferase